MAKSGTKKASFVLILTTASSPKEARLLGKSLVQKRLAACVSIVPSVRSVYQWKGKLEASREELLIIKTRADMFGPVEKKIRELHSYEVPEILCLPIQRGSASYLNWLQKSVR